MSLITLLYFLGRKVFRALLCPSSGARDYNFDYHIGNDQCGNQHYSRELLMMGIVVPKTFWAYKKYNKVLSDI